MSDSLTAPPRTPNRIGIAADHGGFESKAYLTGMLREAHFQVVDFGDTQTAPADDYPDFVVPLARAVARGEVDRGVAICGSGVGACIAANKVRNVICLGGRVVTNTVAWELVKIFLQARFSGAERHCRRVAKVARLENREAECVNPSA
jgi:ribose 5-phosphate isomerase B